MIRAKKASLLKSRSIFLKLKVDEGNVFPSSEGCDHYGQQKVPRPPNGRWHAQKRMRYVLAMERVFDANEYSHDANQDNCVDLRRAKNLQQLGNSTGPDKHGPIQPSVRKNVTGVADTASAEKNPADAHQRERSCDLEGLVQPCNSIDS